MKHCKPFVTGSILLEPPLDDTLTNLKILKYLSVNNAPEVVNFVQDRDIFAEPVESVPTHAIDLRASNQVVNLMHRQKSGITLTNGLIGTISQDNRFDAFSISKKKNHFIFLLISN